MAKKIVKIKWGSEATRQEVYAKMNLPPSEYEFATEGEAEAFLDGIEEAMGWVDYEVVEEEEEDG